MNISASDVLIFAEDPGAANFVADLPDAFMKQNFSVNLFADGLARKFLRKRNKTFISIDDTCNAVELIECSAPKVVLVGTGSNNKTLSLSLIEESRNKKIISIAVIDAAMSSKSRFSGTTQDPMKYAPDWLMVPTEMIRDTYVDQGYREERVIVTGNPQYDYVKLYAEEHKSQHLEIRRKLFPHVELDRKILVFVAEGSARLKRYSVNEIVEFSLKGRGKATGMTEIVIEELMEALDNELSRPYLVLRLHPKDNDKDYSEYLHEFDEINDSGNYLELLSASSLVVGMTSMMMLEAAFLGRPTLSILPMEEQKEWLPTIAEGITSLATTAKEIQIMLNRILDEKNDIRTSPSHDSSFFKVASVQYIVDVISDIITSTAASK